MKDNLTEIVFVLDRSGSMGGLEEDTIGGYNGFLDRQRALEGEANITTVLFDDRYEIICDRANLKNVPPLSARQYFVRGSTALLDAIGKTIDLVGSRLASTIEPERPRRVVFVITTDGMENASRQYSLARVKSMIEHQSQKYSWEFLFLGANMDAVGVAGDMGIRAEHAVQFTCDSVGVETNYSAINEAITSFRATNVVPRSWKAEIENHRQPKTPIIPKDPSKPKQPKSPITPSTLKD